MQNLGKSNEQVVELRPQLSTPKLYRACARDHDYVRMLHQSDDRQVCQ